MREAGAHPLLVSFAFLCGSGPSLLALKPLVSAWRRVEFFQQGNENMESLLSHTTLSKERDAEDEGVMALTRLIWWPHQPLEVRARREVRAACGWVSFSYDLSLLCQDRGSGHFFADS